MLEFQWNVFPCCSHSTEENSSMLPELYLHHYQHNFLCSLTKKISSQGLAFLPSMTMFLLSQGSSCFCCSVLSFSTFSFSQVNMGQFQLLLPSVEQNIPGCTVLLLSLSRLTSTPFQLKALRNIGMLYVKKRETAVQKILFFFLKKFTVLWYCRTKKELHLHPFLYSGQRLWVGRTDTKQMHWFSSWRKVLCFGPFLKEHNLIQALPGWEQFYIYMVLGFFLH